jgi:hypothetical protein
MRLTVASLLVVAMTACGSGEESTTGRGDTQWETFTSDIDGLTVGYPAMWHRAEAPLAAALAGDQVEVRGWPPPTCRRPSEGVPPIRGRRCER